MALFDGTDRAEYFLPRRLSPSVTTDPPGLVGTRVGVAVVWAGGGDDVIRVPENSLGLLQGEEGDDRLYGGRDGDTLDGGPGADFMQGGDGRDNYQVDDIGDRVIDSGGDDSISTYLLKFQLHRGLERLYFYGDPANSPESGIGNRLDNWIYGSDSRSIFFGKAGNDLLEGNGGGDILFGGQGNDRLVCDEARSNDVLRGQAGNDSLKDGRGADLLVGGAGRDEFVFVSRGDSTSWRAGRDLICEGDGAIAFEGAGPGVGDKFNLDDFDADPSTPTIDHFEFGGAGKGEISLVDFGRKTLARGNLDDDTAFEFQFYIRDGEIAASAYTVEDFDL